MTTLTRLFSLVPDPSKAATLWWAGCHYCEETSEIAELFPNLDRLVLVDPLLNHGVIRRTKNLANEVVYHIAALAPEQQYLECDGRGRFMFTTNAGASSSLLDLSPACRRAFPHVEQSSVGVIPLVNLKTLGEPPDVLIMDIQGSEYDVLKGSPEVVEKIKLIYAEVCHVALYDGQGLYQDILDLLEPDFVLVGYEDEHETYGNALWRRK